MPNTKVSIIRNGKIRKKDPKAGGSAGEWREMDEEVEKRERVKEKQKSTRRRCVQRLWSQTWPL